MVLYTHGYNFIKYYIGQRLSFLIFLMALYSIRDCWVKNLWWHLLPKTVPRILITWRISANLAMLRLETKMSHLDLCDFSSRSPSVYPPTLHFAVQLQIQGPWWNWDDSCSVHIFITFHELRCNDLHSYWSIDSFSLCLPLAWFLPRCTANRLKNVRWIHDNNYTCVN